MRALSHSKRHYAIDAKCGEKQCEHGESSEQHRYEAISTFLLVNNLVHRLHLGEREVRVEGLNDIRDALAGSAGITEGTNGDGCLRPWALRERHVDLGEAVALRTAVLHVVIDADDLPGRGGAELRDSGDELFNENALRERIDAVKKFLRESFI